MFANITGRRGRASFSIILLILLTNWTILTVGLPLGGRQEHDKTQTIDSDLIAGDAFLSILMGAANQGQRRQPDTTSSTIEPTDQRLLHQLTASPPPDPPLTHSPRPHQRNHSLREDEDNVINQNQERVTSDQFEGTIIGTRVSSTVGHSMINKHVYTNARILLQNEAQENEENEEEDEEEESTISLALLQENTLPDQQAVASEDAPSFVAEANKSEFHVDEVEPISRDYHPGSSTSVVYHGEASSPHARSVSYSTVIQAIPPSLQKAVPSTLPPVTSGPGAESKDYYVTSKYPGAAGAPAEYNESVEKATSPSSGHYYSSEPTERNWGIPETYQQPSSKPYTPIVYGQPEQNYEVDEAISVETNGRAHGVQVPKAKTSKDDNKVGYVVEGRNYRKYRVEERTSDGFIVGEYGVVRHDDGSLRGVRYTADGTISPRLIYDALMKFLSL